MKKITEWPGALRTFLNEVVAELKKCTWPNRSELLDSTYVVIVGVLILGFVVGLGDTFVTAVLNVIIR